MAELSSNPVIWDKIGDLADLRIGTVRGYKNEDMFDLLVATGRIHAVETTSDEQNLRNLLQGKIAAAVIDLQVFEHLIATTQDLKDAAGKLQFNSRLLAIPDFHVCFQNSPKAAARGKPSKKVSDSLPGQAQPQSDHAAPGFCVLLWLQSGRNWHHTPVTLHMPSCSSPERSAPSRIA
ncbi:hypothetical protein V6L77_04835 [Pannonibacter sp. Pt2-lr]